MSLLKKLNGIIIKNLFIPLFSVSEMRKEKDFIDETKKEVIRSERLLKQSTVVKHHKNSPIFGFEAIRYLLKKADLKDFLSFKDIQKLEFKFSDFIEYFYPLIRNNFKIRKEMKKSYENLHKNKNIPTKILEKGLNNELWNDLLLYSKRKWGISVIGFTKVPNKLIFQNRYISYPYALVFLKEMRKKEIDTAPRIPAGAESMRIYAELGEAVNDIAHWLRERGVKCQSNHPMGGLAVFPALAGKAGLGGQGKMGFLITPEYGVRQRIAPIFIENKIFEYTDSLKHNWIENYCNSCGLCAKECPTKAILDKKKVNVDNVEGISQLKLPLTALNVLSFFFCQMAVLCV